MTVLALDLATSAGWAISDEKGKIVESGTWVLEGDDCEKLTMLSANLSKLGGQAIGIDTVVIEKPWVRGPNTPFLMALRGVAMERAGRWGAEFHEYAPSSVKKSVTGSGSATKETVRKMVERLTGREVGSDDESDAIAVMLCHLNRAKRGKR